MTTSDHAAVGARGGHPLTPEQARRKLDASTPPAQPTNGDPARTVNGSGPDEPDHLAAEHRAALDALVDDGDAQADLLLPTPVDWHKLYAREHDTDWLVEDVWPADRQISIHAAKKTGKSLVMLWIAVNLACGRDPFTGKAIRPLVVTYLDYEMSEADLLERLEEMGFTADDLANLRYYLWPTLPALDTNPGGERLMRLVERDHTRVVVIDTFSRTLAGEENSNDTVQSFFMFTGMRLKRAGVALARLDHEGHQPGRPRGASAKGDDVDVLWQLRQEDDGGYTFTKYAARVSWIPEKVHIARRPDPLGYHRTGDLWPQGTAAKAAELDAISVPLDASRREAVKLLRDAGLAPGRTDVLGKALVYRRMPHPERA